jgi:hypothetical protein
MDTKHRAPDLWESGYDRVRCWGCHEEVLARPMLMPEISYGHNQLRCTHTQRTDTRKAMGQGPETLGKDRIVASPEAAGVVVVLAASLPAARTFWTCRLHMVRRLQ